MSEAALNRCSMCHAPEGPDRRGDFYDAVSEHGMRMVHFWVCDPCAIPWGVGQGPLDPELGGAGG